METTALEVKPLGAVSQVSKTCLQIKLSYIHISSVFWTNRTSVDIGNLLNSQWSSIREKIILLNELHGDFNSTDVLWFYSLRSLVYLVEKGDAFPHYGC